MRKNLKTIEIVKTWRANPDNALLYVFRGNVLAEVRIIREPYISKAKAWRTMTKEEVIAYDNPHLSGGIDIFEYHIRGNDEESIFDSLTADTGR